MLRRLERQTLDAAEQLLQAAGYRIQAAPEQTCCGALYQHAGLPTQARALARKNIAAFADCERIASVTTGCAASLRDYADMDLEAGAALAARVQDFTAWLVPRMDRLQFRPLPLRAALHTPCTALNVMNSDAALRQLLQRIPQLELLELDPIQRCCGAAGTHFITQPEAADRLLQPKLDAVQRLKPDLIVSANIGCSLHLSGGLTRSAAAAQPSGPAVRHPAQVLAAQLVWPPPRS
ncbi:MAG: (Fe-S)-binding protein [Panacagrimonas sp.]